MTAAAMLAVLCLAGVGWNPGVAPERGPRAAPVASRGALGADQALESYRAGEWEAAVTGFKARLRRGLPDAQTCELLGRALLELERLDEAAHYLDRALEFHPERSEPARQLRNLLREADPLASRRRRFLENAAEKMFDAAEKLYETEHFERALEYLTRVEPIAPAEDRGRIGALIAKIRSARVEVDLDAASSETGRPGEWPLCVHESRHYFLRCNLEPEVVRLVGDTMDDIFGYYVQVYFGGDEGAVSSRRATIRIHPNQEEMLKGWGASDSTPGGWWSPGEWKVVCYDTRTGPAGDLDDMLRTLFHEASHQFVTMRSRGGFAPAWINEGTATFFEGASAMADHRVLWPDAATGRLMSLHAMLGGGSPGLDAVVSWSQAGSYPAEYYAWGWGLVYFLQQYEDSESLEYVYRPLYQEYMERITTRGGDSMKLFEEIFLGRRSPQGFEGFEEFEEAWRSWILETVWPSNQGPRIRELRLEAVDRYLAAADEAAGGRSSDEEREQEFLARALGCIDFVRTRVDRQDRDGQLLMTQAAILERMDRKKAAAPLLEDILDLADEGRLELGPEEYEDYEDRLQRYDRRNAALRTARSQAGRLARGGARLLADYAEQEHAFPLRQYTFARLAGLALDDQEGLIPASLEMRSQVRSLGLLLGSVSPVSGPAGSWKTILTSAGEVFEQEGNDLSLEGARHVARICTAVPVSGEYEVRARLIRRSEPRIGSSFGMVVSGHPDSDWVAVDLDHEGNAKVRTLQQGAGGGVRDRMLRKLVLDEPVGPDESPDLAVHVFPEGRLTIRVGERDPIEVELPRGLPRTGHVGIYSRNASTRLEDLVVEVYP